MQQVHDLGYGLLFSNKEIFRQLLISFVHQKWVKDLDFSKCELIKGSFVSKKYQKTFSDLLYKVKLRGRDVYIVILLESKSKPERFTAVQMAGYLLDFYCHLIASEKKLRALPLVFPILLYSGKRCWAMPLNLDDLVEGAELLGKYKIGFECFPIRINSFSRKALLQIGNIVSTLFLAEAHYDSKLMEQEFHKLSKRIADEPAVSLFFNWLEQLFVHERISEADYHAFASIHQDKAEAPMLIESNRREKAQVRYAGKKAGKKEGIALQNLKIARTMLENGEPLDKIKQYTGLSETARLKLCVQRNGKG